MRFKGRSGHASGGRFDALTNFGSARHEHASGEEVQMLPLTEAKRVFRLNDADLRGVRVKLATNPVSPHYAPMKLYRVEDLTRVCAVKYAAAGGLEAFRQQQAERKREREDQAAEKEVGKALRAGKLVELLTSADVPAPERARLLAHPSAAKFINSARSMAKVAGVAAELLASRAGGADASSAPPGMATPAKKAPPRAPAASPDGARYSRDPEVAHV